MSEFQILNGRVIVAAPSSGSGKTVVTLGLLRLLAREGVAVSPVKLGPDYIDPAFHTAACGAPSVNIDPWAMPPSLQQSLLPKGPCVAEAMMGLFDGAADGTGSAADFAATHNMPIVLVVDCASMGHSVAAIAHGFATHRSDVKLAGVILNRVGSDRHEAMLRDALAASGLPVVAVLRRSEAIKLPSRHLGLVQAQETSELNAFVDEVADLLASSLDISALAGIMQSGETDGSATSTISLEPPGQRIAVARDTAFAFFYPHFARDWQCAGASIQFFSPLVDDAPPDDCDVVLLPGGYPELYAERLAANENFKKGLCAAAQKVPVYGECGGFMVLGKGLIDADGQRHQMAGLLPVETSFAKRKLHLGYRRGQISKASPVWRGIAFTGHEFHYSTQISEVSAQPFAQSVTDAMSRDIGAVGATAGRVTGSYLHLICEARNG
ncbi:MAG: cobyrinate a,c-diamide synthase [Pseudomonadota bacterium]